LRPYWSDEAVASRYQSALHAAELGQNPRDIAATVNAAAKTAEAQRIAARTPEEIALDAGRLF